MDHKCSQDERIKNMEVVLNNHIKNDADIKEVIDAIRKDMAELLELNKDVGNIKIAWKVGKSVGYNLTKFVLGMTIILGAIYAIKEWIKK